MDVSRLDQAAEIVAQAQSGQVAALVRISRLDDALANASLVLVHNREGCHEGGRRKPGGEEGCSS